MFRSAPAIMLPVLATALTACATEEAADQAADQEMVVTPYSLDATADLEVQGTASFADADSALADVLETLPGPDAGIDAFDITIEAEGTGRAYVGDPVCRAEASGGFTDVYEGTVEVDESGFYLGGVNASQAEALADAGCELPEVDASGYASLTVTAEIAASAETCDAYCSARASVYADVRCSGSANEVLEARCEANREAAYEASCSTACSDSETVSIVASTTIFGSSLDDLSVDPDLGIAASAIDLDLTFDELVDSAGEQVPEL